MSMKKRSKIKVCAYCNKRIRNDDYYICVSMHYGNIKGADIYYHYPCWLAVVSK